jgi:hypothetical protein
MYSYLGAATVSTVDPEFVTRAWKWLEKVIKIDNRLGGGSFAIIEVMQPVQSLNFQTFEMKSNKICWRCCIGSVYLSG